MASTKKGERGRTRSQGKLKAAALAYAKRGWRVLPLQPRAKRPLVSLVPHGVKDATCDVERIAAWWKAQSDANVGIATGSSSGIIVVDIDGEEGERELAQRSGDPLPKTLTTVTGRGRHLYFSLRNGAHVSSARLAPGLDLKGAGGYVVAPPSIHPSGKRYRWAPGATSPAPLLAWLLRNGEAEREAHAEPDPIRLDDLRMSAAIKKLIRDGVPKGERSEAPWRVLCALDEAGHTEDEIISTLMNPAHGLSEKPREKGEAWLRAEIARARVKSDRGTTNNASAAKRAAENSAPGAAPAASPAFSDDALASTFAAKHAGDLRYVATQGQWLEWDGTRWRRDDTLRVFDLVRKVCRAASAACKAAALARQVASAKTVAAVERLARDDRRIAATADEWDIGPWLLNTPGGTVDLRTGKLRPHDLNDKITKLTSVTPGGKCPRWRAFLKRITDRDLARYLQRSIGYCLTGLTKEEALFFIHGTGQNGKSKFIGAIAGAMGDYHTAAAMTTFLATRNEQHPTDLAKLAGARLVTAVESEEGRHWAESRIKQVTGGDRITARFMRQNFFDYMPQFKIVIIGNHKPQLKSVDEAIRRRMNLIPFSVTIPPEERDNDLAEKLQAEWPGILKWAIEGCLEWQRIGLKPPRSVREATEEYLGAEDAFALWLAERCILKASHYALASQLFADWKQWADAAGETVGSQKAFSQTLQDRGFKKKLQGGTGKSGFLGLKLAAAGGGV